MRLEKAEAADACLSTKISEAARFVLPPGVLEKAFAKIRAYSSPNMIGSSKGCQATSSHHCDTYSTRQARICGLQLVAQKQVASKF